MASFRMRLFSFLFAIVTFLSAFLLFLIEPMIARQLLPALGGSAAVWTTCLVFFQVMLLAGYLYAHLLVSRVRPRLQRSIHARLLFVAFFLQFVTDSSFGDAWPRHPIATIFWMLTVHIGLPFFALAATAPLLQAWYSRQTSIQWTPWQLYALSNAGSILALVLYPWLIEPHFTMHRQTVTWRLGFLLFAGLGTACARLSTQTPTSEPLPPHPQQTDPSSSAPQTEVPTLLLWILLPACSSMLLCAVTNHLSQNVAAIPLLWIVPLLSYLLSFVITFSHPLAYSRIVGLSLNALSIGTAGYILYNPRVTYPLFIAIPVFLFCLFFICFFCHGELYRLRPHAARLTRFYLLVSLGSALGAFYVGIVAPQVFSADYDLVTGLILLSALAVLATWKMGVPVRFFWAAATVAMAWVAVVQVRDLREDSLVQVRDFYGSLRVTETHWPPEAVTTRILYHGTIEHGTQLFGGDLRRTPTSYYAPDSGVGLALRFCCANHPRNIGVVGLGTGTLAAYGEPGDVFTFFEINPEVERLARAFFTYLREAKATVKIVSGDARLSLARQSDAAPRYDVLVLDAFSGDAVPMHLLTAEAIALYRLRLQPDGILAFHVSSQYVDLAPELAVQADHAGLSAIAVHSEANERTGEFASDWVLMTANHSFLGQPDVFNSTDPVARIQNLPLWTDDFHSLLSVLHWQRRVSAPAPKGD